MSAAAATVPAGAARAVPHRGLITLSVMLASIMQALDNTIANVALPRIQGTLSATQDQMSWVLTSYIVAAAIMTPLSGWLAGRFGRRKIFLYSIPASRSPRRSAASRRRCRKSCSRVSCRDCPAPR
jgi:DHA2 family multidrug resistance protein